MKHSHVFRPNKKQLCFQQHIQKTAICTTHFFFFFFFVFLLNFINRKTAMCNFFLSTKQEEKQTTMLFELTAQSFGIHFKKIQESTSVKHLRNQFKQNLIKMYEKF